MNSKGKANKLKWFHSDKWLNMSHYWDKESSYRCYQLVIPHIKDKMGLKRKNWCPVCKALLWSKWNAAERKLGCMLTTWAKLTALTNNPRLSVLTNQSAFLAHNISKVDWTAVWVSCPQKVTRGSGLLSLCVSGTGGGGRSYRFGGPPSQSFPGWSVTVERKHVEVCGRLCSRQWNRLMWCWDVAM